MSSIIRQSSNIAQLSRYSIRCTARPAFRLPSHPFLRASKILIRQTRSHASQSKNSEQPSKKNRPKDGAGMDKKASTPPPSNASTEEQNFTNERNAHSKNMETEKISGDAPLVKGMVKLSADEEEQIAHLLRISKDGLPDSQYKKLEEAFELIKREGISPELRATIQRIQAKPYSLSTAVRLTKLLYQVAERMVKEEKKNGSQQNTKNNSSSPPGFESNQNSRRNDGPKQEPRPLEWKGNDLTSTILISFVSYLIYSFLVPGESSRNITYQEFQSTFLDNGLVEKLTVINENRVRVDLHREATQKMFPDSPAVNPNFHYYFSIGSVESFERKLDKAQDDLGIPAADRIPVNYSKQHDLLGLIINFAPTLLFIGSIVWFSKRAGSGGAGGGVFGMGKTRAKRFNHETAVKVKFADVAGMDEAKLEIMEFVSFLKTPEQFQRLGAKIPRGAILSGPPGTGKTLLAKATAGESEVPFFSVSGSEFMEMFVGVGASRVRDLFALARKNTPCIIFIDEIDAIGKSRKSGSFGGGNDEREATLNQILTEMDGFNTTDQIVVLAGTNRADVLDKALMRPGRFDRHIAIDRPTMDGRKQIFLVHLKKIVTFEDLEYLTGRLSALTPGFSGADIANCCNEAALIAARTSAKSVQMIHFEQAIERVVGGLEKKSLVLSPEEKKVVAYHEAGHAICGWYFKYADPLLKVSIIPRGQGALGYAQYLPNSDSYLMNVKQLMDRMAMTLGGRISEELHFETVTSGASDDFDKVTRLARAMVTQWGMSPKLGLLHFQDNSEQSFQKPFAEATAQLIDSEVRRIVDQAYQQCKTLLTEKKKEIGIIAEELLTKEVLDRNDMVRLLGKRPFDDNKEFEKYFGGGAKSAPPPFPTENADNPTSTTPL